jgi:hypothetical protein
MRIYPLYLRLYANFNGNGIGLNLPSGPYVHLGEYFRVSKYGIYETLDKNEYSVWIFFLVRILAILETLLFLLISPVSILIYVVLFVAFLCFSLINAIPYLLFRLVKLMFPSNHSVPPSEQSSTNVCITCVDTYISISNILFCGLIRTFLSIAAIAWFIVLTPIHIVAPEFTIMVLKNHAV